MLTVDGEKTGGIQVNDDETEDDCEGDVNEFYSPIAITVFTKTLSRSFSYLCDAIVAVKWRRILSKVNAKIFIAATSFGWSQAVVDPNKSDSDVAGNMRTRWSRKRVRRE